MQATTISPRRPHQRSEEDLAHGARRTRDSDERTCRIARGMTSSRTKTADDQRDQRERRADVARVGVADRQVLDPRDERASADSAGMPIASGARKWRGASLARPAVSASTLDDARSLRRDETVCIATGSSAQQAGAREKRPGRLKDARSAYSSGRGMFRPESGCRCADSQSAADIVNPSRRAS